MSTTKYPPIPHSDSHRSGGPDPIAPKDIGAATSAQGTKADTAVQPGTLAAVATSGSASDLTTGTVPIARLSTSVDLVVVYTGSAWPPRPTSDPTVSVLWIAPNAIASPPIVTTGTGGMYEGDRRGKY